MDIHNLITPARISITITAFVCVATFYQCFREKNFTNKAKFFKGLKLWLVPMMSVALLFSHTDLFGFTAGYLPIGVAIGFIFAVLSLWWKPACEAFDALEDSDIQLIMSFRTIFGAFLFAGAALSLFPPIFAVTAGLGDLLAGWLAFISPRSLNDGSDKKWRWIVHGWGAIDLVDVAILGTFVVRPWLIENRSPGPPMTLPWICVPLLFALNLHAIRKVSKVFKKNKQIIVN